MMLPMITEKEFCEHIEDDDFPVRYGNPVCIWTEDNRKFVCMTIELYHRLMEMKRYMEEDVKARWTSDGLCIEMPDKTAAEVEEILMNKYGIGLEEAFRQYVLWIAEKPDEFKKWIEEIRKDEEACEYTADMEN